MSSELVHLILGSLTMTPSLLEGTDLYADDFAPGLGREAFLVISELWEEFRPCEIDGLLLSERLGGDSGSFVNKLIDGRIRSDPKTFATRVNEMRRQRLSAEILRVNKPLFEAHRQTGDIDESRLEHLKRLILKHDSLRLAGGNEDAVLGALKTGDELQALDCRVDSIVKGLLPERSITLFHGRGGSGKTWLSLQLSRAVAQGQRFLSLDTKPVPVVYVDFENPLPLLVDRIRRLDIKDVRFWHLSFDLKPPRLDGDDWHLYRNLPAGSLLIFDSLRAAQNLDENSSKDMALVLNRLKELREAGFTVLLLHHTVKTDPKTYKGSTAILDLADHVIGLHRVRRDTLEEIEEDLGPGACYRLGTREKTRYDPFHVYLNFSPDAGFSIAPDPNEDDLQALADVLRRKGKLCQADFFRAVKDNLEIKQKARVVFLFGKGEGKLWISRRDGNRVIYEPI
ncbi:MAG: AAA family ATPase [Candidatus Aminicenantales bacterium]